MSWMGGLFGRRKREEELEEEVRSHLEMAAQEKAGRGELTDEAMRAVRREFGNVELVKEVTRDTWGCLWFQGLAEDVRFGLRMLRKNAGFTTVAVLTLALGIGANTAIFSVVDWALLRPLPVSHPEQLTFLGFPQGANNLDVQFSVREMEEIRSQSAATFSHVAGLVFGSREGGQNISDGLTVNGETKPLQAVFVSGDFFNLLGIKPHLGRFILPSEGAAAGGDPVVVLSYKYWKNRFGGDETIIGKQAAMNGHPVTIVGVAPKGFLGVTPIIEMEGYMPLGMLSVQTDHAGEDLADLRWRSLTVFGRLRPKISEAQAEASLNALGTQIFHDVPRTNAKNTLAVTPLRPPGIITGTNPLPKLAGLFLTLAVLVLALCCVNLANLMSVRAASRQREMAVRSALGAARGRLIRQLVTESVLLALIGCAGGILTGMLASDVLGSIPTQTDMPFVLDFAFDWRVFLYAFGAALAGGVLVGVVPATRASRGNVNVMLHAGGRTATEGKNRVRNVLVVIQVGGSLALLIAAGLFTRSLLNARNAELGFDPRQVANFSLDRHEIGYRKEQGPAFYKELLERLRATPGITSASVITPVPLSENVIGDGLDIPGLEVRQGQEPPSSPYAIVSPGYFETMHIAMLAGRDFAGVDNENSPRVAIINQAMAERFWPKLDPIGRQFKRSSDPKHTIQIVGVVHNTRIEALYGPFSSCFFVPLAQDYASYATVQVRASGAAESTVPTVIGMVRSIAPAMPVTGVRTMSQALHGANGLFLFDLGAGLAAALGALGLALALVGVYGVMSYATHRRTQEIGIRVALGAQPRQLLQMIGRQALVLVLTGVGLGSLSALAIAPLIGDFLIGVKPTDPITYIGVSLTLALAALLAAFVPARRAMRVDPMVALR